MHIQHPVLQADRVQFRGYQANLARIASRQDTLVVLPTGMGKTIVALLVLADALRDGAERVLLMAPTKPLVEQHAAFLAGALAGTWPEQVHCLTGHVAPAKRALAYAQPGIVCATPQVIQNDVVAGHLDLAALDWVVFDEAHRGVGEYPYTFLGQQLQRRATKTRRLGLTASPGHDLRKIDQVRANLGLYHVEIRTPADPDVSEYVQDMEVEWETLPLPDNLARISRRLQDALAERVRALKKQGVLKTGGSRPSRKALLEVAQKLQAHARQRADVPPEVYQALSVQAQAMKLLHAIELAETQGAAPFRAFIEQMREEAKGPKSSKATQRILEDPHVNEAYNIARHDEQENPKLGRTTVLVQEALEADPQSRVIVFANYRSTVESLATTLAKVPGVRPVVFVGQGKRKGQDGMTQKAQQEVLKAFRAGTHNCLVATSVAEEGLDIPDTDLVVFYEPIPSEIRSIQRRGRTGRHREGRVIVLMTKGTQDEAAHWTARRKEQQMVRELQTLRQQLGRHGAPSVGQRTLEQTSGAVGLRAGAAESATQGPIGSPVAADPGAPSSPGPPPGSTTLASAPSPPPLGAGPRIVCDSREQPGGVVRHLHDLGASVDLRNLDVGDFVVSDRVVVERKDTRDFVDSLLDGRIWDQLKAMQAYPKPFLVIEGESLYGHRNVTPEALMGALASISIDHGVPILQTRDALETARFLVTIAKREQGRGGRRVAIRPGKPTRSDAEKLRFILAGFPHIDDTLAERLLRHFGSLTTVLSASVPELAAVEKIGPVIATEVRRLLDTQYAGSEMV